MTLDELIQELHAGWPKRFAAGAETNARMYISALKRFEGETLRQAWHQFEQAGLDLRWPPSPSDIVKKCHAIAPGRSSIQSAGAHKVQNERWAETLCQRHGKHYRDNLRELYAWGLRHDGDEPSPAQLDAMLQSTIRHQAERREALERMPADTEAGKTLRNVTAGMDSFERMLRERYA